MLQALLALSPHRICTLGVPSTFPHEDVSEMIWDKLQGAWFSFPFGHMGGGALSLSLAIRQGGTSPLSLVQDLWEVFFPASGIEEAECSRCCSHSASLSSLLFDVTFWGNLSCKDLNLHSLLEEQV